MLDSGATWCDTHYIMKYKVTTENEHTGQPEIHHCADWAAVERVLYLLEHTCWRAYQAAVVSEVTTP